MASSAEKQIIDLIRKSERILITPSSPPDGDSLGSAIALYLALRKLHKKVTVVSSEPVPETLKFLPNNKIIGNSLSSGNDFIVTLNCKKTKVEHVRSEIENEKVNIIISPKGGTFSEKDVSFSKGSPEFDLIIVVDTAELPQLSYVYEQNPELFTDLPVINIDHHISNENFGKVNLVDIMASSTTEIIIGLLEELAEVEGVDLIDEDIATLLLAGIITDTGSFQNANTTPRSFAKSAKLVSYGARQQEIIKNVFKTKQLSQLKLWGRILSKIQTDPHYRMVWSVVTSQDFKDTGSIPEETGDVIDELMTNAPGAEIIMLMKEVSEGKISVSIRTTTPAVNASAIAEKFDGGGHAQAAGFKLYDTPIQDAEYFVIKAIKEAQNTRLGLLSTGHNEEKSEKPVIESKMESVAPEQEKKETNPEENEIPGEDLFDDIEEGTSNEEKVPYTINSDKNDSSAEVVTPKPKKSQFFIDYSEGDKKKSESKIIEIKPTSNNNKEVTDKDMDTPESNTDLGMNNSTNTNNQSSPSGEGSNDNTPLEAAAYPTNYPQHNPQNMQMNNPYYGQNMQNPYLNNGNQGMGYSQMPVNPMNNSPTPNMQNPYNFNNPQSQGNTMPPEFGKPEENSEKKDDQNPPGVA